MDDELLINMSLGEFLKQNGYNTTLFNSGEGCLEALSKGDLPDIILMDINLGADKLDGPETTKQINARYDIPVVLHSAYTDKETLDRTKEMTKYGYIYKVPGNEQFVLANIEMALKLHSSRKLYRELFHNSNDAIFLHSILENGMPDMFFEVNDVACTYLEYTREELLRMSPADIDSKTSGKDIPKIMRELSEKKRITFEHEHITKSGRVIPVEISSHQFTLNKKPIIISSVRNISIRKKIEKELKTSEELHRTTLSSISDTVFLTDDRGEFIYVCPNVDVIFGYSEEEVSSLGNISVLFKDLLITSKELDAVGEESNIERSVNDKHGNSHVLLVNVKRVSIRDATRLYTCRDITELKRSEQMYRELSIHLQNVREEQNAYIAREIHDDLGQSLTALKMNLTMAENSLKKIQNDEIVTEIRETAADMKTILNGIVRKVRALTSELRPPVLDTMGIVEALKWHIDDFKKQFGVKMNFSTTVEEIEMESETSLAVFRIVQEALTNSIRHGSPTEITVSVEDSNAHLEITVADNGIGFSREKTRRKNMYGLIGMQERARQCGGILTIDSTPGAGTTITLKVPFKGEA